MNTETNQKDISACDPDDLPTQKPGDTDYGIHTRRIVHVNRRVSALSARIDALERARAAGATVVNDHASRIETMTGRINAGFAHIRDLRTDPITQPLPASPAPVEPAPVPETPEETATRLLGDPEALALFMNTVAGANGNERQALADELMRLPFDVRCSNGLRLLAAAIAAGSFSS